MEKLELLYTSGGNIKWYSYAKKIGSFFLQPTYVLLLGIYSREMKTPLDTNFCTWMSIAALFIIARNETTQMSTDWWMGDRPVQWNSTR